jgi:hypothetical protein
LFDFPFFLFWFVVQIYSFHLNSLIFYKNL